MAIEAVAAATQHLRDVLVSEKAFLLEGRMRDVAGLVEEKLVALQAFETEVTGLRAGEATPALRHEITQVIQMSEENGVLLNAARNGLSSLIGRIGNMHQDAYVGLYGQGGGSVAFPQATGQYRKWV